MKTAIKIEDIAKELGLSRNTVSKALNGKSVPEKTKNLVLQKAQELNYKSLGTAAFDVGRKKYRLLLVSAKPLNNMNYFVSLISSIEAICLKKHYDLFQYTYNEANTTFEKFKDYLKSLSIDGIIAIECFDINFINKLLELNLPICFHDFAYTSRIFEKKFDIINTNDEQCISSTVKKLINTYDLNRFTFVGDNRHCRSFRKRYTGMLLGLINNKKVHNSNEDLNFSETKFDYSNINELKKAIKALPNIPEVFICSNDFIARNICYALKELKINVPKDTLVVGFDNATEASSLSPTITTFATNKYYLGLEIIHTLEHRIENKDMPSRAITINAEKIERESTSR